MNQGEVTLRLARRYAQLGYPVFPCTPGGKRPMVKGGLRAATTDPDLIDSWWRRWPAANLAVLPPAEVLVLDVDEAAAVNAWWRRYLEVRQAPCTRTPRGGAHAWLRLEQGAEKLTTRVKAASGRVDLRGLARAYLIVPPSCVSGQRYWWERPLVRPTDLPRVSPPLFAEVTPKSPQRVRVNAVFPAQVTYLARRYALAALRSERDRVAATAVGARNARLNRAAYALGGYVAHGLLAMQEVEQVLLAAAQGCGLSEAEACRTIRSGLGAGREAPRPLPVTLTDTV